MRSRSPDDVVMLVGVASLVAMSGCCSKNGNDGDDGDDMSTASSSGTSDCSTTQSEAMWPEASFGPYYLDLGISLGVSQAVFPANITNIELRPEGLSITLLNCDGTTTISDEHEVIYDGEEARVVPKPGATHVIWLGTPVASELVFRPGTSCAELETELIEPASHAEYPDTMWYWRRGAAFISDLCDTGDLVWAFDLSPDVPTECDG